MILKPFSYRKMPFSAEKCLALHPQQCLAENAVFEGPIAGNWEGFRAQRSITLVTSVLSQDLGCAAREKSCECFRQVVRWRSRGHPKVLMLGTVHRERSDSVAIAFAISIGMETMAGDVFLEKVILRDFL